jgi:hypothetical protein
MLAASAADLIATQKLADRVFHARASGMLNAIWKVVQPDSGAKIQAIRRHFSAIFRFLAARTPRAGWQKVARTSPRFLPAGSHLSGLAAGRLRIHAL